MSYNGIGLSSAKGSSTSGYVQQSLAINSRRNVNANNSQERDSRSNRKDNIVQQDENIKSHKAKREIEVLISEYRDRLEEEAEENEELTDDVIDSKCEIYRKSLNGSSSKASGPN